MPTKTLLMFCMLAAAGCQPKTYRQATIPSGVPKQAEQNMPPLSDEAYRRWNGKLLSGIDFIATGTEPFWSLEINLNQWMHFKLIGGDSIITPPVQPVRLTNRAATSYQANVEKGRLNVVVYDSACINNMSGDTLPKTVEVYWNDEKYYRLLSEKQMPYEVEQGLLTIRSGNTNLVYKKVD